MSITKLTRHNNCKVQIVFGLSWMHHAHLECCDPSCKLKKKWIQWLGPEDTDVLRDMGIPVVANRDYSRPLIKPEELGI